MEKEKILSEVKTRLGKTQLSDRTILAFVENNLPSGESDPDDEYYTKAVNVLKALQGQFSHDVSTQVEEFKKTFKPADPVQKEDPPKEDDSELQQMRQEMEEMKRLLTERDSQAKKDAIRKELINKAAGLNVTKTVLWNDVVSAIAIDDNATASDLLATAKADYEAKLKSYVGEGAIPYSGTPIQSQDSLKGDLEKFAESLRASGKIPQKEK